MNSGRRLKVISTALVLVLLVAFLNVPVARSQEPAGCSWQAGKYVCESSGEHSTGYYPFVGGGSCCNCGTKHYGTLPDGFPEQDVGAVTFPLTASRANSYYTSVQNGPTALTLVFTDSFGTSYSSTATSVEVSDEALPVDVPWYITFEFDSPVRLEPGTQWELRDGDGNVYSAAWLHMSDVDGEGLPGTAETFGCSYAEKRSAWYSVIFEAGAGEAIRLVSTTPTLVTTDGPKVTADVSNIVEGMSVSLDVDVAVTATYMLTGESCYEGTKRISLQQGETKTVEFQVPTTIEEDTPIEVVWSAAYSWEGQAKSTTYSDYVLTAADPTVKDMTGHLIIVDNVSDDTISFDWDNLDPAYKDSLYTTDDGMVNLFILEYTTHNSIFDLELKDVPIVGSGLEEGYESASEWKQEHVDTNEYVEDLNDAKESFVSATSKTGQDLTDWGTETKSDLIQKKNEVQTEITSLTQQASQAVGGQKAALEQRASDLEDQLADYETQVTQITQKVQEGSSALASWAQEQVSATEAKLQPLTSRLSELDDLLANGGSQMLASIDKLKDAGDFVTGFGEVLGLTKDVGWAEAWGVLSPLYDITVPTVKAGTCWLFGQFCPKDEKEKWGLVGQAAKGVYNLAVWGATAAGYTLVAPIAFLVELNLQIIAWIPDMMEAPEDEDEVDTWEVYRNSEYIKSSSVDSRQFQAMQHDTTLFASGNTSNRLYGLVPEGASVDGGYGIPISNDTESGTMLLIPVKDETTGEVTMRAVYTQYDQDLGSSAPSFPGQWTVTYADLKYAQNDATFRLSKSDLVSSDTTDIAIRETGTNGGDLDLHVYAGDRHIGMNYETGQIENQVPGAWYSGDGDTSSATEMILLPADVKEYRIVVDARGAAHAEEQYEILTTVVRGDSMEARAVGEAEIGQGDSHDYHVSIVEDGGEISLDTDIGEGQGGGSSAWIVILVIVVLAVLGLVGWRMVRAARS